MLKTKVMGTILHKVEIPNWIKWLGWILLIIALILFKSCEKEVESVVVVVPEKKGKFDPVKPKHTPLVVYDTIKIPGKKILVQSPINDLLLRENEELKKEFREADSINKELMHNKAIQLNRFNHILSDDFVSIDFSGIVRGEIQEISTSYTLKERKEKVEIKHKETYLRILGGVEFGNRKQFDDFKIKGNLMIQDKKGNIYTGSFDTEQTFWIGINKTLFDLKR